MFPYYNRVAFLNAMEMSLTNGGDVIFLRENRERLLDETADAQNADQMAAMVSHLLDPYFVVVEEISPTTHERIERQVDRCRNVALYVAAEWQDEAPMPVVIGLAPGMETMLVGGVA